MERGVSKNKNKIKRDDREMRETSGSISGVLAEIVLRFFFLPDLEFLKTNKKHVYRHNCQ